MEDVESSGRGKLAFGFSRKVNQKLLKDSRLRDESTKDVEEKPDFVLSVSKHAIESLEPRSGKKELIIPLIMKNNWRLPSTVAGSNVKTGNEDVSALEAEAVQAILTDVQKLRGDPVENGVIELDQVLPIIMRNRIPAGYETDDKMDVTLRAEESTIDDYDRVPIEEYGVAMLKGMGWKEGQGIGAKNKKVVAPIEVNLRPKGLGLGADVRARQGITTQQQPVEDVTIVIGGYVQILEGFHKDSYGQVDGLDMENARVVVRLTLSSKIITVSEHIVRAVSKSEFKKEGKLINKSKYDEYKAKSDANLENARAEIRRKEAEKEVNGNSHEEPTSKHSKRKHKSHKRDHSDDHKKSGNSTWIRPSLRVRFIDKSYKDGKYYNTKVIIEDVVNKCICICRTDHGRILEDIPEKSLETVIPRSEPPIVMVVKGDSQGQLGEILDRNKEKCVATVQLFQDREILQLDYDSICEYVGEINDDY